MAMLSIIEVTELLRWYLPPPSCATEFEGRVGDAREYGLC